MLRLVTIKADDIQLGDIVAEGMEVWLIAKHSENGIINLHCGPTYLNANHRFDYHKDDELIVIRR